jgi:hypothetical protein
MLDTDDLFGLAPNTSTSADMHTSLQTLRVHRDRSGTIAADENRPNDV